MTIPLRSARPKRRRCRSAWPTALCLAGLAAGAAFAQPFAQRSAPAAAIAVPAAPPAKVVVSGTVPDEATRVAILSRVRELYGAERVVDQLGVGALAAPPQWTQQVQKLLGPDLRRVSQGQIKIEGHAIELVGAVDSEPTRDQVLRGVKSRLDSPHYHVHDALRVQGSGQQAIDQVMANRVVEFETGNAQLTPTGQRVLDELLPVLNTLSGRRFEIIGHTDSDGTRENNLALSQARAETVRAYLVQRGIPAGAFVTSGAGPDKPVADNGTREGRARNRRIEFRLLA